MIGTLLIISIIGVIIYANFKVHEEILKNEEGWDENFILNNKEEADDKEE